LLVDQLFLFAIIFLFRDTFLVVLHFVLSLGFFHLLNYITIRVFFLVLQFEVLKDLLLYLFLFFGHKIKYFNINNCINFK